MNPYKVDGPAVISFSGGRTSGFMLAKIVEAHGGILPDDVHVVFANTGLEHTATYDFVQKVSDNIAPVTWVEYTETDGNKDYKVVDYNTCSRNGEPMDLIIARRKHLPSPVHRFCTGESKIATIERYLNRQHGLDFWTSIVGIRHDEQRRLSKMKNNPRFEIVCPVANAGHTIEDVKRFWSLQPFDLQLPYDNASFGNCVGCFLKGTAKLLYVFEKEPNYAKWWMKHEEIIPVKRANCTKTKVFRIDRQPYRQLLDMAQSQRTLDFTTDDIIECSCTD